MRVGLRRNWVLAVGFVGSCAAAWWLGNFLSATLAPAPLHIIDGVGVEVQELYLGEVWEQAEYTHRLTLRNCTDREIQISDFSLSCNCVAVEPRSLILPPRRTSEVLVRVDLTERSKYQMGMAERPLSVSLRPVVVAASGGSQSRSWELSGIVVSRVILNHRSLVFGEVTPSGQGRVSRVVRGKIHVAGARPVLQAKPDVVTMQVTTSGTDPSEFEARVTPNSTLPLGEFQFEVSVDLVTPDGDRLPGTVIRGDGIMRPAARAVPSQLLFGRQPLGGEVRATVILDLPESGGWKVGHLEVLSRSVQVVKVPGANWTYEVRQSVLSEGLHSSTIRFNLRDPMGAATVLGMEVSYEGAVQPEHAPEQAPDRGGVP